MKFVIDWINLNIGDAISVENNVSFSSNKEKEVGNLNNNDDDSFNLDTNIAP